MLPARSLGCLWISKTKAIGTNDRLIPDSRRGKTYVQFLSSRGSHMQLQVTVAWLALYTVIPVETGIGLWHLGQTPEDSGQVYGNTVLDIYERKESRRNYPCRPGHLVIARRSAAREARSSHADQHEGVDKERVVRWKHSFFFWTKLVQPLRSETWERTGILLVKAAVVGGAFQCHKFKCSSHSPSIQLHGKRLGHQQM